MAAPASVASILRNASRRDDSQDEAWKRIIAGPSDRHLRRLCGIVDAVMLSFLILIFI
jgi:hypothetical protein